MARLFERLILPEIAYDGLTVDEVLQDLEEQIKRLDKSQRQIKFRTEQRPALARLGDPSQVLINIKLPLFDVSLKNTLDAMVRLADQPIEYELRRGEVVFRIRKPGMPKIASRAFRIDLGELKTTLRATNQFQLVRSFNSHISRFGLHLLGPRYRYGAVKLKYDQFSRQLSAQGTEPDLERLYAAFVVLGLAKKEESRLPNTLNYFRRMREIVIPEIAYDGLTVDEALQDIIEQAKRNDPEKRGLNLLMADSNDYSWMPDSRTAGVPQYGAGLVLVNIREPIFNRNLEQVFYEMVRTADLPLRYVLTEYAIMIEAWYPGNFLINHPVKENRLISFLNRKSVLFPGVIDDYALNDAVRRLLIGYGIAGLTTIEEFSPTRVRYDRARGVLQFMGAREEFKTFREVTKQLDKAEE